jgi:hypothetical protein
MRADTAEYAWKWQVFHYDLDSFPVLGHFDHGHISLNIQVRRTTHPARCRVELLDGIAAGNRLSVMDISGLTMYQSRIIFAGPRYRTDFYTISTCCTDNRINIAWGFAEGDLKVSIFSVDAFNI